MTTETRKGKTLLPGHTLQFEGHARYGREGRCSCGAKSEALPTAAARKRWHAEHKDALRMPPSPDGSTYSLSYQWPRGRVIVHVHQELDAQSARGLASSLIYFAERVEASRG